MEAPGSALPPHLAFAFAFSHQYMTMALTEDEKASSSFAEDTQRTRLQRWFAPTTEYLAHWGIETNGFVFAAVSC